MILSAATLRKLKPVEPFCERGVFNGLSFGLSYAGIDIRIAESFTLSPNEFKLGSSIEKFCMPANVMAFVKDKSSLLRRGLSIGHGVIESFWKGFLTLELKNIGNEILIIEKGMPIAQIIFFHIDGPTEPYKGKYDNQEAGPQKTRYET